MSQRIDDSLEVLDLIRELSKRHPKESSSYWRNKAVDHVASRGVESKSVYANLIGKNTYHKLSANEIDSLIKSWINNEAPDLKDWIIKSCGPQDKERDIERITHFFSCDDPTPIAIDINEPEPSTRHLLSTYRILRDTALARRIKAENNYMCQICNKQILLIDDNPYAEAHHVKPLGGPHDGPDHPGNIICVCPNCHVKLDYGVIKLDQEILNNVLTEFIKYHNEVVCKKKV